MQACELGPAAGETLASAIVVACALEGVWLGRNRLGAATGAVLDAIGPQSHLKELGLEHNCAMLGGTALLRTGDELLVSGSAITHASSLRTLERIDRPVDSGHVGREQRLTLLLQPHDCRNGAEIDLRLRARPAFDAAVRNPATTPALEAACRAMRRQLRLSRLRLHGNGFGAASRAALACAAAEGPLAQTLALQLTERDDDRPTAGLVDHRGASGTDSVVSEEARTDEDGSSVAATSDHAAVGSLSHTLGLWMPGAELEGRWRDGESAQLGAASP